MEDISAIVGMLADVGGTVIVTAMLWVVWKRLSELTDRFIDILGELRLQSLEARPARPPLPIPKDKPFQTPPRV